MRASEEIKQQNALKGVGPNPTDRGKMGVKESVLVEREGGPLAIVVAGANINDHLILQATLESIVVERPTPSVQHPQNLCLDKGYDNAASRAILEALGYVAHIKSRSEEKACQILQEGDEIHPARRWVVERTIGWLLRWRGILVRWEKLPQNYVANLKLACALLWMRRAWKAGSRLLG